MDSKEKSEYTVPDQLDGERLDRAAAQLASGLSRARLKRAIEAGAVRVNGRRKPKGAVVAKGDVISIDTSQVSDADSPAEPSPDAPLVVCFEGEGVLVVDKPAGQPTAPLRPGEVGSLANALVGRYPELAGVGYSAREPGLVHRLDTDTSGLVLAARSQEAFDVLRTALKEDRIDKRYLLLCASADLPDEGSIEFPIANHPKDQRRVYPCIHPRDVMRYAPRPASTSYRVIQRGTPWALVEVTVSRALRHQIRVHFAAIEHPLAGDVLYGGAEIRSLGRHALHASLISFAGGPGVAEFNVTSKLPPAMAALVTSESEGGASET
ncbi:RluA family pseudouridine synthase [Pendulispora rubella]|uniref:RluA family pseudouridine synthase n=1 Tax=Pendulispora rubella TaxID=2741070 RepID=A0ABZ2KZU6_9BACT